MFVIGIEPDRTQNITYFNYRGNLDQAYADNQGEDFKVPTLTLGSISVSGILVITFSDEFVVPDKLQRLKAEELII